MPEALADRLISDSRFSLPVRLLAFYTSRGAMWQPVYIAPAELSSTLDRAPATIRRALHALAADGYLSKTPRGLPRGGRGNAYRIKASSV